MPLVRWRCYRCSGINAGSCIEDFDRLKPKYSADAPRLGSGSVAPDQIRFAFLILAHHQPDLLRRLASRLSAKGMHLFVHVDRKTDIEDFRTVQELDHTTFLPDDQRVSVRWSGFSMVVATLNLLRVALAAAPNAQRFVLMSGVDYPIKPLGQIVNVLSGDEEFIQIDREIDPDGDGLFDRRLGHPYFGDNKFLNDRSGHPRMVAMARRLESRFRRRRPPGLKLFYGPQWWALTRQAVTEMLAFLDSRQDVFRWFKLAQTPDESMIHSIVKITSKGDKIAFDATRVGFAQLERHRHALHYIDWINPNPSLPRILELADLGNIEQSGALFARKVDLKRSSELLDALDDSIGCEHLK